MSQGKFSSIAQRCLTLCNPMDCNTPDFPAQHQLLELAQTHVHHIGDTIQPLHSLFYYHFTDKEIKVQED